MRIIKFIVLLPFAMVPAMAHHSVSANYDASADLELEGEITAIAWRNPHIEFTLETDDGSQWELSTHSVSIMRRLGAAESFVDIGDSVRVAGWPARRGNGVFVNNMLLPSGEEFVFKFGAEPGELLWSDRRWGTNQRWFAEGGDTSEAERGIFRVWSSTLAGGDFTSFWLREYPLTEGAIERRAAFDPAVDDPLLNCGLKGMPAIMSNPYPMEFHDRGDVIELHLEEYDTVRKIYINADSAPAPTPSILGHSTGHWDGDTLVVETTHINWGHLGNQFLQLSDDLHISETITAIEDGGRLEYAMTITDDYAFTEPVTLSKSWVYLPDVQVEPYNCEL